MTKEELNKILTNRENKLKQDIENEERIFKKIEKEERIEIISFSLMILFAIAACVFAVLYQNTNYSLSQLFFWITAILLCFCSFLPGYFSEKKRHELEGLQNQRKIKRY